MLRTIDKVGGLDEYLLGEKSARIKELGIEGWALRWRIMQTKAVMERVGRRREEVGVPMEGFEERGRLERASALKEARGIATEYVVLKERVEEMEDGTDPISQLAKEVNGVGRQIWLDTQAASIALSLPTSLLGAPLRPLPNSLIAESTSPDEEKLARLHQTLEQLAARCEYAAPTLLANARTTLCKTRRAEARAQAQEEGAIAIQPKSAHKSRQTDSGKAAENIPLITARKHIGPKQKAEEPAIFKDDEPNGASFWARSLARVRGFFGGRK